MAIKPNQALVYKNVPGYLRERREQAALTQRDLATRVGKPQWWVHRIETGSRRVDVAEFIEWCIGCDVDPVEALRELVRRRPKRSSPHRGSRSRT